MQYDKEFFGQAKHLLELSFGLGDMNYLFVLGPLQTAEAIAYTQKIHETALNAKTMWVYLAKVHNTSTERGKRLDELSTLFGQELSGKVPEKAGIIVENNRVESHQTFLPSLNPLEYYDMMRKRAPVTEAYGQRSQVQ